MLFAGAADFEQAVVESVRTAPPDIRPMDAVLAALTEAGAGLTRYGEPVRHRQRIVTANPELRERELIKMDSLTTAVTRVLTDRGAEELTAELATRAGVAAFTTAFQRWTETDEPADFPAIMTEVFARLRAAI